MRGKAAPPQTATKTQATATSMVAKPNLLPHPGMVSAKSMGFFAPKNTSHGENSKESPPPETVVASAIPVKSSNSNPTSQVDKSTTGVSNSSLDLEPFHNENPTNDLFKCIDEIDRELKKFDLPKAPLIHTVKDSPTTNFPPKIHLIHMDGDTSHIKNFSPTHLPPSSPPHISPLVSESDVSNPGYTPINNTQSTWKRVTRAATGPKTQKLGRQKKSLNNIEFYHELPNKKQVVFHGEDEFTMILAEAVE